MSVLENFKNIPRSPTTGLKCNFFLQICNEVPGEKKGACRPPNGRQGPYFPLSFEPKNSGKKRGVMKHRSINIPSIVCNGKYESDKRRTLKCINKRSTAISLQINIRNTNIRYI